MKGKKFAVINLTIATLGYQTSTNKWDLCTISRHFCLFFLLCVRRLFGTRRISTSGKLSFHLWKVYFLLVESLFSTSGKFFFNVWKFTPL